MKRDNLNYVMVGAFVATMAVAFVVLLFAVTGRSGPTETYYVYYDNVAGLKFGTGVYYEGYRIGQVESIAPEATGAGMRYKVELSVNSGWKIPADSVARVEASGLISAVTIEIEEGKSDSYLRPGDTIAGRGQVDIFAALNQAASDFRSLSQDGIMPMLSNLNSRINQISDTIVSFRNDDLTPFVSMMHKRLDEDVLARSTELLDHLDASARSLQSLLGGENQQRVSSFLSHIDDVALNLNELVSRIEVTRRQMNGVLESIGTLVEDNRASLGTTVSSARASMAELERALTTVNEHLGIILENLETGSRHMSEFARSIRENPSRLLRRSTVTEPGAR